MLPEPPGPCMGKVSSLNKVTDAAQCHTQDWILSKMTATFVINVFNCKFLHFWGRESHFIGNSYRLFRYFLIIILR